MAEKTISQIADKVACGGAAGANTGKLGCLSLFGNLDHAILLVKGTKIPGNESWDLDLIRQLVIDGKAIPLMGASMFEDVSAEDGYATNAKGVKRLNLKGLPEYRFTYEEGHEFYRQLDRLGGYKNFDWILGDDEGNWMMTEYSDGSYGGFDAGHTTPELTARAVAGGDAEHKSILVQFLNRLQFDRNYAILHQEYLDFSPQDVPAVNGVVFEYLEVPVAGSELKVKAVLAQDRTTIVEGLEGDFAIKINGVNEAATAVVGAQDGEFTITTSTAMAATDNIELRLGMKNTAIVDVDGILFRALPEPMEV